MEGSEGEQGQSCVPERQGRGSGGQDVCRLSGAEQRVGEVQRRVAAQNHRVGPALLPPAAPRPQALRPLADQLVGEARLSPDVGAAGDDDRGPRTRGGEHERVVRAARRVSRAGQNHGLACGRRASVDGARGGSYRGCASPVSCPAAPTPPRRAPPRQPSRRAEHRRRSGAGGRRQPLAWRADRGAHPCTDVRSGRSSPRARGSTCRLARARRARRALPVRTGPPRVSP